MTRYRLGAAVCIATCTVLSLAGCDSEAVVSGARDFADSGSTIDHGLSSEQASQLLQDGKAWRQVDSTSELASEFDNNYSNAQSDFDTMLSDIGNSYPFVDSPNAETERKIACAAIDYDNQNGRWPNPDNLEDVAAVATNYGLGYVPRVEMQTAIEDVRSDADGEGNGYLHSLGLICSLSELKGYATG